MSKSANAPAGGGYGDGAPQPAAVSWRTKVGYVGTGIVIGIVIYPFVRRTISRVQPGLDKFFDGLTGKAEGLAEMASDLIAKAKQSLRDEAAPGPAAAGGAKAGAHDHAHGNDHDHDDH
jgi:hypothetical protein